MKRIFIILIIFLLSSPQSYCIEAQNNHDYSVTTYSESNRWGLKSKNNDTIITPAIYKKIIRLEDKSWIVQNKKDKFGLIDNSGRILVPIKYANADRLVSKFVKFGNVNDFGVYDSSGKTIVKPVYSKIDILYGGMFLTYKNYKYGIVGYDGNTILENEFDDIYMPKPNVMKLEYNGRWYELEQVDAQTLTLPTDAKTNLANSEDLTLHNIVVKTGAVSGYSVVTFSDYIIKLISSISPAHEDTIDELILSKGADTVSILVKLKWLPKYPVVYTRKYYENVRNPNNGPLSNIRKELKQQIK